MADQYHFPHTILGSRRELADEHAVAIAKEAIFLFDGMTVRRKNVFPAGKSSDQREKR